MDGRSKGPKLEDQIRTRIRFLHYSLQTERAYVHWYKRYVYFHNKRHPGEMAEQEIVAFLNHLATKENVSASTQNQALNALVFLYKQVLGYELDITQGLQYAKRQKRLPVVLTVDEVTMVLSMLAEPYKTMASLMYGSGLRLMECLRLRVQDVDFLRKELFVRSGKGGKDRVTVLPDTAVAGLRNVISVSNNYFQH